ncbi:SCAN domain-containing protein 3 [Trichonephila clavipes]|nr:SCAN domain-containing protein 3 [Trichonephila clavipes]
MVTYTSSMIRWFPVLLKHVWLQTGEGILTNCQEDDTLTYIQHLNALCSDFGIRYKDILTMAIAQWLINRYDDIEEMDVVLQEELIGISTNEELKVQFKNGY